MNRATRRKKINNSGKSKTDKNIQIVNAQTTGLAPQQLVLLLKLITQAQDAFQMQKDAIADQLCRKCLALFPEYILPMILISKIANRHNQFSVAIIFLEKALQILPSSVELYGLYGFTLQRLRRPEDALDAVSKCIKLEPGSVLWLNEKAGLLNTLDRAPEAIAIYEQVFKKAPAYGKAYYNFSLLHKFSSGDKYEQYFLKLETNLGKIKLDTDLVHAHFALGKYYEDLQQLDKSMPHYLAGNKLQGKQNKYDFDAEVAALVNVGNRFKKDGRWLSEASHGCTATEPLFIVGMPRSGTTLVEQILTSHAAIHGGGELRFLGAASRELYGATHMNPEILPSAGADLTVFRNKLKVAGQNLAKDMLSLDPHAKYIIDKLPQNFLHLGFKHLLLPNAKIIHCKRDPIDTCLSNFRLQFEDKLHFTTDLEKLGRYYVAYATLMDHWKEIFKDQILEIQYEDVVADLEGQARRIINFLDLEWDDACLDFHNNKRSVHTASVNQVRQ
ncbi:MAG: sulfotransferase, partial [Sneathiella sp.]